jgi:hypothetical protein
MSEDVTLKQYVCTLQDAPYIQSFNCRIPTHTSVGFEKASVTCLRRYMY